MNNVMHRDIKPQNIALDSKFTAKIIDLGLTFALTNFILLLLHIYHFFV